MTISPSDDELLSAVLDGEATPEEEARVRAEPALAARLEVLRSAATAVAEPVVPLDEITAARLRAAALEAATGSGAVDGRQAPTAPGRKRSRATWLAVAAAIVVAVGVAGVVGDDVFQDGDDQSLVATGSAIGRGQQPAPMSSEALERSQAEPEATADAPETVPGATAGQPGPDRADPGTTPTTTVPAPPGEQVVPKLPDPAAPLDEEGLHAWAEVQAAELVGSADPGAVVGGTHEADGPPRSPSCPSTSGRRPLGISDATWGEVGTELVIWDLTVAERLEIRGTVSAAVVIWRSTFGGGLRLVTATDPLTCEVLASVDLRAP